MPRRTAPKRSEYGATIRYRCGPTLLADDEQPDDRPLHQLPSLGLALVDSEVERDRVLSARCVEMEAQGYVIVSVERFDWCARCKGDGTAAAKPKGWRRRNPPPYYLMRRIPCSDCPDGLTKGREAERLRKSEASALARRY